MRFLSFLLAIFLPILPAFAKLPSSVPPNKLSVVDWKQIRAEYERHRHGMFAEDGGYQSRAFEQQWLAHFDGRGMTVVPNDGAWQWGLELAGVEGEARVTTSVNRITYAWGDVDEWYVNDTRGLEHGFTLRAPREIVLAVRGGLLARMVGADVEFVDEAGVARMRYMGLAAWDADGKKLAARMDVEHGRIRLAVDDRDARYPITIDPVAQQAYLKASNTGSQDEFGYSVAIAGDTVVVGARGENSIATGINGNQADFSAPYAGAAYVFVRSGATWTQQAYLKASNTDAAGNFGFSNDFLGVSVAISGETVVVGAPGEASSATGVNGGQNDNSLSGNGAAYVFVRNGATWTQQAYLKSSTPGRGEFGWYVGISGDSIVVGASKEDGASPGVNGNQSNQNAHWSGAAYVFVRSGGNWSQQAYLKASNPEEFDFFGWSVAISGNTVAVGAIAESSSAKGANGNQQNNDATSSGAVYVFERSGTTWAQQAYLKASNSSQDDHFGYAVAIAGNTLLVGAPDEASSGAAYVLVRNGATWTEQAFLKPSGARTGDHFGGWAALEGDTAVVGADLEDSESTGVNGSVGGGSPNSGAAYVFVRNGGSWSQHSYLKASNTGAEDRFGMAVAVSGDTVVVGAAFEDSNARGVDGIQSNNSNTASGAAYVFAGFPAVASVTITSAPAGLVFRSTGAGCDPGTGYTTPRTLQWSAGSACVVQFNTPQTGPANAEYKFDRWEDNSTNAARSITAPGSGATYTATFTSSVPELVVQSTANYVRDQLAPLQIVYGASTDLAPDTLVASSPWPTSLLGASVQVKDSLGTTRTAGMVYIFPTLVSFLIPAGTANGVATVDVVRAGAVIARGTINIAAVSPGLYTANSSGSGAASAVVLRYRGDEYQGFEYSFTCPGSGCVPAQIDLGPATDRVILSLYGSGFRGRSSPGAVTVTAGGTPLEVLYVGAQGTIDGLDQVNVVLSRTLIGRGLLTVELTVDGRAANAVQISVK